jgi:hypothetical protein
MTRLTEAVAFTDACDRCRVRERDRAVILQKARRLDRVADWLASAPTSDARKLREAYDDALEKARRDVRDASDWRAVTLLDAAYPERLRHISEPPAVLFWSGTSLDALQEAFVLAVVGTRRPTAYGVEVTRRLTREAVLHGVPIVSGGARGIDGEAHRAALNLGGPTYAVLGCGLGVVYPPEHETLFNEDRAQRRPHHALRARYRAETPSLSGAQSHHGGACGRGARHGSVRPKRHADHGGIRRRSRPRRAGRAGLHPCRHLEELP